MEPAARVMGRIGALLTDAGVHHWGVCALEECRPLLPCRGVDRIPAEARSVIVCLFPYWTGEFPGRNVARYAVPPDYHQVAGQILEDLCRELDAVCPDARCAAFVDNSPIPEVRAAQLAGVGRRGRHGLLLAPDHGGHVFIGTVVSTLDLPAGTPAGPCPGCGRCVAACPTGALSADGAFDQPRCRSFLTQKKGDLTPWEREQIHKGGLVWGCDLCTDACPLNTKALSPILGFTRDPAPVVSRENLDRLRKTKAYGYRGQMVLMRNLALIQPDLTQQHKE